MRRWQEDGESEKSRIIMPRGKIMYVTLLTDVLCIVWCNSMAWVLVQHPHMYRSIPRPPIERISRATRQCASETTFYSAELQIAMRATPFKQPSVILNHLTLFLRWEPPVVTHVHGNLSTNITKRTPLLFRIKIALTM